MQTNQSTSANRQLLIRALVGCFALAVSFLLVSFAVRGRMLQGVTQTTLSVDSGRPVAEAILKLEGKYGWVVTYEDPFYLHESEIEDVTLKVRRDLDKYKPGEAPKVFVPKGGALEFTYDVATKMSAPTNSALVLQNLLDAQAQRNNGGRFRLESRGGILHVIPTMNKDLTGMLVPQESVLDTIISLPEQDRTVYQKLVSVCAAVERATGVRVGLGTIPDNWFLQERNQDGATSQKAREVLINTFAAMEGGSNLSWRLLYGPDSKTYSLNVHYVSKHSEP